MIVPRPDTLPKADSIFMIVNDNSILQGEGESIFPGAGEHFLDDIWHAAKYTARIGVWQGKGVYLIVSPAQQSFDRFEYKSLRALLEKVAPELFALAGRACQIAYFIRTHNFCSYCGDALEEVTDELAVYCRRCDYRTYPRISPCIIVAIYRVDRGTEEILLARGARHAPGMYSVLAGFVESGESLEQTLHREVFEETGVQVDNLEYITSQQWPFPHSLMAGFVARYAGGDLIIDGEEILQADWFSADSLPTTPPSGTIAARLIEHALQRARIEQNKAE